MRAELELNALKPSSTARPGWLLTALALSLLIHLALLLIKGIEAPARDATSDLIIALQRAVPERPMIEQEPVQGTEPVFDEETPIQPLATERPEDVQRDAPEPMEERARDAQDAPTSSSESIPAPLLSTRLLSTVRDNLGQPREREQTDPTAPARIPDLPAPKSWIDQYVGRVEASREVWENRDGSRQARVVTEDGQVFCGKADAPTPAEIFNPSLATSVMRWRDCGRVRPDLPDLSDPRLRTPRPTP
jgi:hypothetical protein